MDNSVEILLGSQKNINSVNVDNYTKIELTNKKSEINEFTVNDVVNSTEVFDTERNSNAIYRIYGRIEWLSLLNGLTGNYSILQDFFYPAYDSTAKTILNSFDFYLVRPASSGYTNITNTTYYKRFFEVIATNNDFEIYPAGFSNNVYGEQIYSFNFKSDFDVSSYFDEFGFPATELYLYGQYKTKINGNNIAETMSATTWVTSTGKQTKIIFPSISLNVGDFVQTSTGAKIGDMIDYNADEFLQTQISGQTIYISTEYKNTFNQSKKIIWKYNPFISLRLRYFDDVISTANTGSTSYDIVNSIPNYATKIDNNGNYVWRNILQQGYLDPATGIGVNYPFINGRRYLFSTIIFGMQPDLNDINTKTVFNEISYSKNATNINITPISNLNNIGAPCQ